VSYGACLRRRTTATKILKVFVLRQKAGLNPGLLLCTQEDFHDIVAAAVAAMVGLIVPGFRA
jgi:hypothetical protein